MTKYFGISLILLASQFLLHCSTPKYLPKPSEVESTVNGLYVRCNLNNGALVIGELIDVSPENVKLIIPAATNGPVTISKQEVKKIDVLISLTSEDPKKIRNWVILNNLIPITHGWFLIFTVPINMGTTIPIASDAMKGTYIVRYPNQIEWEGLQKFARFPQGIPATVDVRTIR